MLLISFMCLIFLFMGKIKYKSFRNHITVINVWWGIWILISSFNLLNFKSISIKSQFLVFLGILFLNLGDFISFKRLKLKERDFKNTRLRLLYKINFIIMIINIIFALKAIKLLMTGIHPGYYRFHLFDSDGGILFGNRYIQIIYSYFIVPFLYGSFICGALNFLNKKKKILIITSLNLTIYSVITVGRFGFLLMLFIFISIAFYEMKIFKYKSKIILPVILLMGMSVFRGHNKFGIIYTLMNYVIKYFTGSFIVLGDFLEQNQFNYQYGRASLGFIDMLITPFLKRVFDLKDITSSFTYIGSMNASFIDIGTNSLENYNAFYTMFQAFYMDFNIVGVMISSFILGKINSILFYNYKVTKNKITLGMLVYINYITLLGIIRWEFLGIIPLGVLLVIMFTTRRISQ